MSTVRRYTAEQMIGAAECNEDDDDEFGQMVARMLRQAAETEARVVGLMDSIERAYREGFRDGSVDCIADERGLGGVGEDAYWSGSNAREALSKFRGEDA